jgi:hypothetical protein
MCKYRKQYAESDGCSKEMDGMNLKGAGIRSIRKTKEKLAKR